MSAFQRLLSFLGVVVGLFLLLVLTLVVFRLPVGSSLGLLFQGSMGNLAGIGRTLEDMTPLLLTALGVAVAWRAGMFNIGGEGQYVIGAATAAAFAKPFLTASPVLLTAMVLLGGVVGGAVYGGLAGWLKTARGVDVVISTILLNFVAIQILGWLTSGPLREPGQSINWTSQLPYAAMLYRPTPASDLNAGILISLFMAVALWFFLFRTKPGFLLRVVGDNPSVARANRFKSGNLQLLAMLISGGLCGLAGAVQYAGVTGRVGTDFSQQWGFLGIPVALLGGLNPLGTVLSSFYFGALLAGSTNLGRFTHGGDTMVYVVQAVAVFALVGLKDSRLSTLLGRLKKKEAV